MLSSLNSNNTFKISFLIAVFHFLLAMLLWSYYMTIKTSPEKVPAFWGLYIDDDDNKRRRFCVICRVCKPRRSHHCGRCNCCILNMHYHCVWVDNCIGFYNRKFYMILLFYFCCIILFFDFSAFYYVFLYIKEYFTYGKKYEYQLRTLFVTICYIIILVFTYLFIRLYKKNLTLVLNNSTNVEILDNNPYNLMYRLSCIENWKQVFGFNPLLWFIPLALESGKSDGDGINWKTVPINEEQVDDFQQD